MMTPRLISITTMIPTRSGFVWWQCEVDVPDDIPDATDGRPVVEYLQRKLIDEGMLAVTRLHLMETSDHDRKVVTKRTVHLLGRNMVGTIAAMRPITLIEATALEGV